ncbi:DMT family transporter [Lutispora thermophila]|uniref:Threonine/homoserine efflux transporter RhtA n=1 Tax=Lutispora thermophila DSM 19022 TaxID=1122184 RepID=A0A1M6D8Q1_9FIRM|nr:DMT family transporter [Lutispora thermophila]SHI69573.1 Threonine/homoserine efflux transporter RhtA [Lutispora thermophila DSM 19022]
MKELFRNERYKAIFFIVLASLLWSTGGILIKVVDWNPIAIAGSRSLIASIVVFLYLKKPRLTWSKAQLGGAFSYAATVILFVAANKLTTSANAILLQFTSPIFVAILGVWLLKEKIRWYDYIAILSVFGGMLLFFLDGVGGGSMLGNVLAVVSGFFLACVTICLRLQKSGSPVETTLIGNVLTFIVAIPFIVGGLPDLKSIIAIIVLGVFQLGISYILYALASKHLSAIEAVLLTVIEPLLNPVWVFLFAGEKPSVYAVVGGIIVILSVTIRSIIVSRESGIEYEAKESEVS